MFAPGSCFVAVLRGDFIAKIYGNGKVRHRRTADASAAGACKIESWLSWASNSDFVAATSPGCGVSFFRPLELSAQITHSRSDGEWATGLTPKAKMHLVPTGIGAFGLALSSTASFDLAAHENTSVNKADLPVLSCYTCIMRSLLAAAAAVGFFYVADRMFFDGRYSHAIGQIWRQMMMHFGI